jgi:DNA-binding beta-propeller fold protein YncE
VADENADIAGDDFQAWVADQRSGVVSKIDRSRYRVVRTFRGGTAPGSVFVSNGVMWVTDARDHPYGDRSG